MEMKQTAETGQSGKQMWLILVLVAVVIGAGVWWYALRQGITPVANNNPETSVSGTDTDLQALTTQGSSDDVASIDADLKATNLDNLDRELGDISNTVSQ